MGRKSINLMIISLISIFVFSFGGCNNSAKKVSVNKAVMKTINLSTDKTFDNTIEEKLNNITHPKDSNVLASSNPYDYIKSIYSDADYKYIVSKGEKSLNFMLNKFANSTDNGIEEYIMAIACSDILRENPMSKNWDSGRKWYNDYLKQK